MRSSVNNDRPTAMLGFDETFLRPFARALVEASTTRAAYRMTILNETRDSDRCRVVEYVTGPGKPLKELVLQPFDNVVLVTATTPKDGDETLFQLPRTDSFLRAFAKMAYTADQALHDLLDEMERVARRHKAELGRVAGVSRPLPSRRLPAASRAGYGREPSRSAIAGASSRERTRRLGLARRHLRGAEGGRYPPGRLCARCRAFAADRAVPGRSGDPRGVADQRGGGDRRSPPAPGSAASAPRC